MYNTCKDVDTNTLETVSLPVSAKTGSGILYLAW